MTIPAANERCYLIEWYQPDLGERGLDSLVGALDASIDLLRTQGRAIRLLLTVALPGGEILYSVFAAESADTVTQVCRQAGWPPDRITADIDARIA